MAIRDHWLDESLQQCMMQDCDKLTPETAKIILNLVGAIRSLERQINCLADTCARRGEAIEKLQDIINPIVPLLPAQANSVRDHLKLDVI
jgi:hypothetical protein